MAYELRNELVDELKQIQLKYTYFLMAAAGASLGFGVQKLDGQSPGQPLYVGLGAMALWIVSIALGCLIPLTAQAMVRKNLSIVDALTAGDHIEAGRFTSQSNKLFHRIRHLQHGQFLTLAAGVILFATWRVLLIFHASYASSCIP